MWKPKGLPKNPSIEEHEFWLHVCYLTVSEPVVEREMTMSHQSPFWNLCLAAALDLTTTASMSKL